MQPSELSFREMTKEDCPLLLDFIKAIAKYEKLEDQVQGDIKTLEQQLFEEERAHVFFLVVENKEIGYVLYFYNYSTFVGRKGLYLEDLFIYPEYRHKGYGKAAFLHLAKIAKDNKCGRMEWVCLNWNKPSIDFYHSLGAVGLSEWTTYRLSEDKIEILASKAE